MVSGLAKLWSFYLVWGLASNFPFVRYNSLRDGLSKSEMKKIINFRGKKIGAFLSMVPCLGICLIVTISTKALTFHVFGYSSAGNGRKHFFQISFENSEKIQTFGAKTIFVAPIATELPCSKVWSKSEKWLKNASKWRISTKNHGFSRKSRHHEKVAKICSIGKSNLSIWKHLAKIDFRFLGPLVRFSEKNLLNLASGPCLTGSTLMNSWIF